MAVSPEGVYLATASFDDRVHGSEVRVWEVATKRQVATHTVEGRVKDLVFRGEQLLGIGTFDYSGKETGSAYIWNWRSFNKLDITRLTPAAGVHILTFSPDGMYLVTNGRVGTAQVWEVASGREIRSH